MATTYSMPTDESLVRVAKAIETGNGIMQRVTGVTGGYVMFTSKKPAESDVTTRPCLVIVTTTGEMYLVADDLVEQTSAKQDAWPDEEEAKRNVSWDEEEDEPTSTTTVDETAASTETAGDSETSSATDATTTDEQQPAVMRAMGGTNGR